MPAGLSPNLPISGADLAFAIGLPPEKAVEHLRAKGLQVSAGWRTMSEAAQARAFTVANVTRADVLADIQAELLRAQQGGLTMAHFRDNLIPSLNQKGWFAAKGEPVRVPDGTPPDPATGELATRKRLTARRLKTIFQTNMQSSMMAARYRELMANVSKRPWFQYVAILDGRTRPAHRAMNGRVFRYDDAGWSTWWPPCGFGCRCRVRALDQDDLADKGITPESSAGKLKTTSVTQPDGSTTTVTRYTPASGPSFAPDPGFNGNPAQLQAADRLLITRVPQVLPADAAAAQLREVFTAAPRLAEVRRFVELAREAAPGQLQPAMRVGLGALDDAAVLRLADEDAAFDQAAPVTLGALAACWSTAEPEELAAAAEAIAYGSITWDANARTLVYVHATSANAPGRVTRVVVAAKPQGNEVSSIRVLGAAEVPAGLRVRLPIERGR